MMRIVFFGTPDFAVAALKALVESGRKPVAVVTAPDKAAGRGQHLIAPPVKTYAMSLGIPVLQPENLKAPDFIDELRSYKADIQIVVAFRMLPESVWNMPPLGTYNVHGSLLPDYRGAAPINWAIVNGETETGVSTFKLKHEIDTGSILLQESIAIGENENAGDLYEKLMHLGARVLIESLEAIDQGRAVLRVQPVGSGKHAPKIQKDDALIHWDRPAAAVHNFIRGMNPFPGAFTRVEYDGRIESWKIGSTLKSDLSATFPGNFSSRDGRLYVSCKDRLLEIIRIQPPGKKSLTSREFLNGFRGELSEISCL